MTLQHSPPPKRKNHKQPPGSLVSAASDSSGASAASATVLASGSSSALGPSVCEDSGKRSSVGFNATQPVSGVDAAGKPKGEVELGGASTCGKKSRDIKRLDSDVYKPWGSRSRSNSETCSDRDEGDAACKGGPGKMTCGEEVKDGEPGVQCDVCMSWFHADCQAIPKAAHSALQKFKMLSWICAACKLSIV